MHLLVPVLILQNIINFSFTHFALGLIANVLRLVLLLMLALLPHYRVNMILPLDVHYTLCLLNVGAIVFHVRDSRRDARPLQRVQLI